MSILVALLLILKICLSVEINFWKTPLRITFKNLRSFQGKDVWRSSILAKVLSLRFTVNFAHDSEDSYALERHFVVA